MSIDFAGDGDAGLAEDVGDLGLAEARGVVFEGEMVVLFVDAEAAEAVGVGKFAQAAELLEAERGLQFVGDFEECHGRDYSRGKKASDQWPRGRAAGLPPEGGVQAKTRPALQELDNR